MMRLRTLLLMTTALMPFFGMPAFAGPEGAVVVGGQVSVQNPGTANVTVNQFSDKAVVNWHTFNIGANERTQFVQPNSNSVILNRVTGGLGPSEILGRLDANGKVFVVNRDGFLFGAGAVINTAGFLATTSDIKNDDFMAGRYNFSIPGRSDASIVNMGTITAANGGFAGLVAPGVRNSGTITANLGTVVLGAGNIFTLDMYGDKLITLGVNDQIAGSVKDVATGQTLKSLITNTGKLSANGGRVELTAAAARQVVDSVINTSGVIEANSVGMKNGQIVLGAATASTKGAGLPTQTVKVSGTLSAAGKQAGTKGGKIIVTGENIVVAGANIDASGSAGGGKVLIGGDWGGGNPNTALVSNQNAQLEGHQIANATTLSVDGATKIDVSAKDRGDGGKVVLWSDGTTSFAGTILALGGQEFGNGGFVETSGKAQLNFAGNVDTRAPNGSAGVLLLDPADYYIDQTFVTRPSGASVISVATLNALLLTTSVVIATDNSTNPAGQNGDIFVSTNAAINWTGDYSLTLSAYRNVVFADGATITHSAGTGGLTVRADSTGLGAGSIILNQATNGISFDFTNSNGKVSFYYNPSNYTSPTDFTPAGQGGGTRGVTTNGLVPNQFIAYMLVNTAANLQAIGTNTTTLAGNYALGVANLDMSSAPSFAPIGDNLIGSFTGRFEGLGNTISNLTVAPTSPAAWNIGVFGMTAIGSEIKNLNFTNLNVVANSNVPSGVQYVGGVVGQAAGTLTNVHVNSGSVNGLPGAWVSAGGLVGMVSGTISNSSSAANTSVANGGANFNYAGGLAGRVDAGGDILNSSASGIVAGGTNSYVGGLAGESSSGSTIVGSSATGNVFVNAGGSAGGLVGFNTAGSVINNATSSGNVTALGANAAIGGLVGQNAGSIANSTVTGGLVSAGALDGIAAGGLVGRNTGGISVASSAANVTIGAASTSSQENNVGGLVGVNTGTIGSASASGIVTAGAHSNAGGLVGRNEAGAAIASSFATGTVNILAGLQTAAGGLVGFNFGSISNSHATGQISGADSILGGLAGINDATGTITTSYATGAVIGGTNSQAGGFVGSNNGGSISGSHATGAVSSLDNSAGGFVAFNAFGGTIANSYATGNVIGGGNTTGGFVGDNAGTITGSYASGNVTGSGESTGGFAGTNDGTITTSNATGAVTSTSSNGNDSVGGFVSDNNGLISDSHATGNVTGLNVLAVGGFAGSNAPGTGTINNSYASGNVTGGADGYAAGFVGANGGDISNSHATGTVTGGDGVVAAGFAALNYVGNITGSWASGAVTGGNDSLLGGLVGFNLLGTIAQSYSTSTVSGGSDTIAGGLLGLNVGTVSQSFATGAVSGGDNSFLGGLVALNYAVTGYPTGIISQAYATGAVTGGANSYVGGLVALNGGSIDQAFAAGLLTGGTDSTLGGLVASNTFFDPVTTPNGPTTVPVFSTTPGTATNSYWDTQTTGQDTSAGGTPMTTAQLTAANPSGFDNSTWSTGGGNYPCLNGICNPAPTPGQPADRPGHPTDHQDHPTSDIPVISPQVVASQNLTSDPTGPKTDSDPTPNTNLVTNSPGPSGGQGGGQNGGRPSGNQVPPPGLGPLPSGMPPLNETRFLSNEVVMQLGTVMTPAQIAALTRSLGLEIITQQNFDVLGRTVFRFRIAGHLSVRDVIKALEANRVNVSAQPSYTYSLTQDVAQADLAGAPADINRKGDSAQYIVDKLRLVEAHTIATGKDVKVAVIDSEIDAKHPDLQGVITATYDALPSADQTPHPHGTGMAGAIASHRRLLGIAPGAKLLAVRAFGIDEKGAQGTSMNIVKGLEWAVAQGAKVINMSFAGPRDPILQQAIKKLSDDGIILIAAAGNAGPKSPPLFPGADANVIAVSATDIDDKVYKNANRGKYVAIAAPGVDILVPAPDGGYQLTTGTSVAAAHISGVVALLKERNPQLRAADIRNILSVSAKNIGPVKTDVGAGLVDPIQALSKAGPKSAELR